MRPCKSTAAQLGQFLFLVSVSISFSLLTRGQAIEKIQFDTADSTDGYYLAIQPNSKNIQGVVVLLTSFLPPEGLLPETKLHNVACVNNLLTIVASCKQKLYADSSAVTRLNSLLKDVLQRFSAGSSTFVLAGYDEAGNIALRYTELAQQTPAAFPLQPKAVFAIDAHVDLFGLWHWSEKQIKKNYWAGAVGDAKYYLDAMTKEHGTIYTNPGIYKILSPFNAAEEAPGNEQYLKNIPVRLYYDTDIEWQLKNRRNGLYDTKMPDGAELIKRLLLQGNKEAAFMAARQPGFRADGTRTPNAMSIIDEVECIQWIRKSLHIFDARTWVPPYHLMIPEGWSIELFTLPPGFAPQIKYKGVEDIRFAPGWGDPKSDQHWTYGFLWWLEDNYPIDAGVLQQNLKDYYAGLLAGNITRQNIPANKIVPTIATVKKIKTLPGDAASFTATISMLDYHTLLPMLLYCSIHVKDSNISKRTAIFFEVSPQMPKHPVWQQLHAIEKSFSIKTP